MIFSLISTPAPMVSALADIAHYKGRSICNENSPVYPKVLYLHTS